MRVCHRLASDHGSAVCGMLTIESQAKITSPSSRHRPSTPAMSNLRSKTFSLVPAPPQHSSNLKLTPVPEIYRIVSSKALEGAGQEPNLKGFTLSDSETANKEKTDKGCC